MSDKERDFHAGTALAIAHVWLVMIVLGIFNLMPPLFALYFVVSVGFHAMAWSLLSAPSKAKLRAWLRGGGS